MRWLVRLYPRRWRERHGDEVVDLLSTSSRPVRDALDVVAHAALAWLEMTIIKAALVTTAVVCLVAFGLAVGQLADGVAEVHRHWWSSAAAAAALGSVGLLAAALLPPSRRFSMGRRRQGP